MPELNQLLDSIRQRKSRTGIVTADRYFREVEGCFNGGTCPIDLKGSGEGDWTKALKDAEGRLTYTNRQMRINRKSLEKSVDGGILAFDAIITTPLRDRDGDVLLTKGAQPDLNMPLLWQHIPMQPIGKMAAITKHTKDVLKGRFVVANTPLGRDAAELIRIGALRISHGFDPKEWEPMEDEKGWLFKLFEIFETSVVSIPSNVSAVIESVSKGRLETDLMRGWAEGVRKSAKCECHKGKSSTVTVPEEIKSEEPVQIAGLVELKSLVEKRGARLSASTRESLEGVVAGLEAAKVFDAASAELVGKVLAVLSALMDAPEKSFEDIEREYIAALANEDTDAVRKSHRRLSLILRASEEFEEAREWDELFSTLP